MNIPAKCGRMGMSRVKLEYVSRKSRFICWQLRTLDKCS